MLIKTKDVSYASDKLVLTQEQVRQLSTVDSLVQETRNIRDNELKMIKASEEHGFQKGYREGYQVILNEMKTLFIEHLESTTQRVIETHTISQQSIIELALNITRKISTEVGPDDMITGIIHRAVKNLKSDKPLEIKVNEQLAEDIEKKIINYLQANSNEPYVAIEVIPDPNMGILDCIIKSDYGETDASFEQQLNAVEEQLSRAARGLTQNS
jgi:flagellar biosynthesis/type III secretory pathway protein FliH